MLPPPCTQGTVYAARRGDQRAQYNLGLCHLSAGNAGLAIPHLASAAAQGLLSAQYQLGTALDDVGDPRRALYWYAKAGAQGDTRALFNQGISHQQGLGTAVDHAKATESFVRAADLGHKDAAFLAGKAFGTGVGAAKDPERMARYTAMAAELGHVGAMFNTGMFLHRGMGMAADPVAALKWYRAAASRGHDGAARNAGLLADELGLGDDEGDLGGTGDTGEGTVVAAAGDVDLDGLPFLDLSALATAGGADAQHALAMRYKRGDDGMPTVLVELTNREVVNRSEGVAWLARAAAAGHSQSLHDLAAAKLKGEATAKDHRGAFGLLAEAAAQGHAASMLRLAGLRADGRGCDAPDAADARGWLVKAADAGSPVATQALDVCGGSDAWWCTS